MLSEQQCRAVEQGLVQDVEPRKIGAYLCLNMGLTLAEVCALRWGAVDLEGGTIFLGEVLGKPEDQDRVSLLPHEMPRVLPMPPHVKRFLETNSNQYPGSEAFVLTGAEAIPSIHSMQNSLSSIRNKIKMVDTLSAMDLRNAFIRRCIEAGMDLYSLCAYVGIKQPNVILKRFESCFKSDFRKVALTEQFNCQYEANSMGQLDAPRRMNLLILGAGSHGPVVQEIAQAIGVFYKISFLDDNGENELAIGPLSDLKRLASHYPMAIPSFGSSHMREKYADILEEAGYVVPTLVHPTATVSPSASLDRSVVVEARSVVSAGAVIERGALIASASVIEPSARVGQFSHVGSAVTVAKNAVVPEYVHVPSGTVVRG